MTSEGDSQPVERTCEVERQPKSIEEARRFAERCLGNSDSQCREAVTMAVQEFAENLAKYGSSGASAGTISLCVRPDRVRIRVNNLTCSRADAEQVEETIAEIAAAPCVRELYRRRQRELLERPNLPRARLGLLRVAFEGGFRLSCVYVHPALEIVAEREGCRG